LVKIYKNDRVVRTLLLKKIRNDHYVTDPTSFDEEPAEIKLTGKDSVLGSFEKKIPVLSNPNKRKFKILY
jgi:hypothetical protein